MTEPTPDQHPLRPSACSATDKVGNLIGFTRYTMANQAKVPVSSCAHIISYTAPPRALSFFLSFLQEIIALCGSHVVPRLSFSSGCGASFLLSALSLKSSSNRNSGLMSICFPVRILQHPATTQKCHLPPFCPLPAPLLSMSFSWL
jgi:hypothetical protein